MCRRCDGKTSRKDGPSSHLLGLYLWELSRYEPMFEGVTAPGPALDEAGACSNVLAFSFCGAASVTDKRADLGV